MKILLFSGSVIFLKGYTKNVFKRRNTSVDLTGLYKKKPIGIDHSVHSGQLKSFHNY